MQLRILFSVTTEAADRDKQAAAGDAGAPEQQPGLLGGKPEPPPLDGKQMLGLISKSLQSVAAEQDQVRARAHEQHSRGMHIRQML